MAGKITYHAILLTSVAALATTEAFAQMPSAGRPLPSVEVHLEVLQSLQMGGPATPPPAPVMPPEVYAPPPAAPQNYGQGQGYVAVPSQPPIAPYPPQAYPPAQNPYQQQQPPQWAQDRMNQARSQMGLGDDRGEYSTYQPQQPPPTAPQTAVPPPPPPVPAPPPAPLTAAPTPDPLAQNRENMDRQLEQPAPPPVTSSHAPSAPPAEPTMVPPPAMTPAPAVEPPLLSPTAPAPAPAPEPAPNPPPVPAKQDELPALPIPELPKAEPPKAEPPKVKTDITVPDLPKDTSEWLKDSAPKAEEKKPEAKKPKDGASPFPSLNEQESPPPMEPPGLPDMESLPPIETPSLDAKTPPAPILIPESLPLPPAPRPQEAETGTVTPALPPVPEAAPEKEAKETGGGGWFPGLTRTFKKLLSKEEKPVVAAEEIVVPALPPGADVAPIPPEGIGEPKLPEAPPVKSEAKKPEIKKSEAKKPNRDAEKNEPLTLPEMPKDFPAFDAPPPLPPLTASPQMEIVEENNKPIAANKPAEKEMAVATPQRNTPRSASGGGGNLRIVYGRDATALPDTMKAQLSDLAKQALVKKKRLTVTSYASGKKDEAKAANMVSLSRALSLRAFLIEAGLPQDKIIVKAKGLENPGGEPDRADVGID